MKNPRFLLILLFGLVFAATGCQKFRLIEGPINLGAPKFPTTLCAEHDASTSYILKVSSEQGIPLNEVYYGLLDSAQLGVGFKVLDREKVKVFMVDLADWYEKNYPMNFATLVKQMKNQDQAMAVTSILSRRIGVFSSTDIIGAYDDCLLRAGWNDVMDQLWLR